MYEKLFERARIGNLCVKNRLVMSPMGCGLAEMNGDASDAMIAYYEERARGGAGIIITGITRVDDETGLAEFRQLAVSEDHHIEPLRRLADTLHKYDTRLFIQLHHPGRQGISAFIGGQPVVAPSAIPCTTVRQETRALEIEEIKAIEQKFIDGAVRAQKAGCDGVEVHAAHGYLVNQFLSPHTNKRTDEYGGSYENRMRFAVEIIQGIREACGPDFAVGVRISGSEDLWFHNMDTEYIDVEESIRMCKDFEKLGVDFIDISRGTYESGNQTIESVTYDQGCRREMLKQIRDNLTVPTIGVSVIREPAVAEDFVENGIVDFVSLGRAWIADPQWGNKAASGREKDIRRCIGCLYCAETENMGLGAGTPLKCAINPLAAHEIAYKEVPNDVEGHRAVVIGAGPAGLSAACTLAERNVSVTLIDRMDKIGGRVNIAAAPPKKDKFLWLMEYYERELARLHVDVRLGTDADAELISGLNPDAVVLATGGAPIIPSSIPGIRGENVYIVNDVLDRTVELKGRKVVLIGAGMTGIEAAEFIAHEGNDLTIIEMGDQVARDGYGPSVMEVMDHLMAYGPDLRLNTKLKEITPHSVIVEDVNTSELQEIEAEAVVLSFGYKSENSLLKPLTEKGFRVYPIGDASEVRRIGHAVRSGFEIGRELFNPQKEPSFITPKENLDYFFKYGNIIQEGISLAYLTDPEAIARILPPPLAPFAMPIVTISLMEMKRVTMCKNYYEAIMGVYCMYDGKPGSYTVSLMLEGEGAEMAADSGREFFGLAKKLAHLSLERNGDSVKATVSRRGTTLLDVDMKLGEYNSPFYGAMNGFPKPGDSAVGQCYYVMVDSDPDGEMVANLSNARLIQNDLKSTFNTWEPGNAKVKVNSSVDDAWGSLPVRAVIGGAYLNMSNCNLGKRSVEKLNDEEVLPYIINTRFDQETFTFEP